MPTGALELLTVPHTAYISSSDEDGDVYLDEEEEPDGDGRVDGDAGDGAGGDTGSGGGGGGGRARSPALKKGRKGRARLPSPGPPRKEYDILGRLKKPALSRKRPQSAMTWQDAATRRAIRGALSHANPIEFAKSLERATRPSKLDWELRVRNDHTVRALVRRKKGDPKFKHDDDTLPPLSEVEPDTIRVWLRASRFLEYAEGYAEADWVTGTVDTPLLVQWTGVRRFIANGFHRQGTVLHLACCNGMLLRSLLEWSPHELEPFGCDECAAFVGDRGVGRVLPAFFQNGHFVCMEVAEILRLLLAPPDAVRDALRELEESDAESSSSSDGDIDSEEELRRLEEAAFTGGGDKTDEHASLFVTPAPTQHGLSAHGDVEAYLAKREAEEAAQRERERAATELRREQRERARQERDQKRSAKRRQRQRAKEQRKAAREAAAAGGTVAESMVPHCTEAMVAGLGEFPRGFAFIIIDLEEVAPFEEASPHLLARLVRLLEPKGRLLLFGTSTGSKNKLRLDAVRATGYTVDVLHAPGRLEHVLGIIEERDRPSLLQRKVWYKRLYKGGMAAVRVAVAPAVRRRSLARAGTDGEAASEAAVKNAATDTRAKARPVSAYDPRYQPRREVVGKRW